ncbi:MSMEG_0567/Sll0786 family nitrogen starvation N-acetyltransferase [Paraburkholderia phosphatilytica]|uniref:MSMEG_0567/Sll0786 family nitrogen starvation N-acetyltransferase n=1 Tax=Paraburkholderia phosphatilytica TaxID=2282883 RepID=UPI000E517A2F|nr:MSMEG_0567/Sll0786 family nitrogen starvation N-acetyltransferase [Paraburkholderia phosphatilytica]
MFIDTFEFEALAHTFAPTEFRIKWTTLPWEADEAFRLRRAVFCAEQGIFARDDRDDVDERAQQIVAVSCIAGMTEQVVGTVRIHRIAPGEWLGSRLAVHPAFRRHGRIGTTLIELAVRSAHACGCDTFFAHVQQQNVALFQRLHWDALGEELLFGRPHQRMRAQLEHYPPCATPHAGLVVRAEPPR